jgi:hypothetical protein
MRKWWGWQVPRPSKPRPTSYCRLHVEPLEDRCYLSASPFSLGTLALEQHSPLLLPTPTGPSVSLTPDLQASQLRTAEQETAAQNTYSSGSHDLDQGNSSLVTAFTTTPSLTVSADDHDAAFLVLGPRASAGQTTDEGYASNAQSGSESLSETIHVGPSDSSGEVSLELSGVSPLVVQNASGSTLYFLTAANSNTQLSDNPDSSSGIGSSEVAMLVQPDADHAAAIDAAMSNLMVSSTGMPMHSDPMVVDVSRLVRLDPNSAGGNAAGSMPNSIPLQFDATHDPNEAGRPLPGAITSQAPLAGSAPIVYSNPAIVGQVTATTSTPVATPQTLQPLVPIQAGTPSQINSASGSGLKGGILAPAASDAAREPTDAQGATVTDAAADRGAANSAAVAAPSQAALLASMPYDLQAVDAALDNLLTEIDELSGDLAGWLGVPSLPRWSVVAAGVVACAVSGQQMRRARRRRSSSDENELESLSRMFTRWQGLSVDGGL